MTLAVDSSMSAILERLLAAPAVDYANMPIAEGRALFELAAAPMERTPAAGRRRRADRPGSSRADAGAPLSPRLGRLPLIVFVHGGGWTFGSIDTHDGEMRHLALAAGAAVLGFDYRLAPEHPFPAPLEDVLAAIGFAEAGGLGSEVDAARIALAGDSAGANLALARFSLAATRRADAAGVGRTVLWLLRPRFRLPKASLRFGDGRFLLRTAAHALVLAQFPRLGALSRRPALAAPLRARSRRPAAALPRRGRSRSAARRHARAQPPPCRGRRRPPTRCRARRGPWLSCA